MQEFESYRQRMISATKSSDVMLGYLVWYSLSDVRIAHDDAVRALVTASIDSKLPLPPKDSDVFRRVCTKSQRRRVPVAGNDQVFENYLIREVSRDVDTIVRRIVVETVDVNGKRLAYDQLDDIVFDHKTSKISRQRQSGNMVAQSIMAEVEAEYALWRGCLNTYSVREWIRHFIIGLGGTIVRPGGGVYFLKEEHADKINRLEGFINSLPGDCVFHSLPLVDDRKQREMLQRAFEAETSDEIDELLAAIAEIRSNGTRISERKYTDFLQKYQALTAKTKEYGELLEEKLSGTHSRLEIFQASIMQLLSQVRH